MATPPFGQQRYVNARSPQVRRITESIAETYRDAVCSNMQQFPDAWVCEGEAVFAIGNPVQARSCKRRMQP